MGSTYDPATRRSLRLTRRGRVVVTVVALILIVAGFSFGRASSQAAGPRAHRPPQTVTVHAGETLWELAQRVAPHVDPRLVVAALERANRLAGPLVEPGQQLVVPTAR